MREVSVGIVGDESAGAGALVRALVGLPEDTPLRRVHYAVRTSRFLFRLWLRRRPLADLSRTLRLLLSVDLLVLVVNPVAEENAQLRSGTPGLWAPVLLLVDFFALASRLIVVYSKADHALVDYSEAALGAVRKRLEAWDAPQPRKLAAVALSALRGENVHGTELALLGGRGLIESLCAAAAMLPPAPPAPVRVALFSGRIVLGAGTIVRGVVLRGCVTCNATLRILPGGTLTRVVSLQRDGAECTTAEAGATVGLRLANVSSVTAHAGCVLAAGAQLPSDAAETLKVEAWTLSGLESVRAGVQLVLVACHARAAVHVEEAYAAAGGATVLLRLRSLRAGHLPPGAELGRVALLRSNALVALGTARA